jgi:hypothetical protein
LVTTLKQQVRILYNSRHCQGSFLANIVIYAQAH